MSETFQSEYGLLKSVLLKHPREAYQSQDFLYGQWEGLNYIGSPDYARACDEFDQFASILNGFGIEIHQETRKLVPILFTSGTQQ